MRKNNDTNRILTFMGANSCLMFSMLSKMIQSPNWVYIFQVGSGVFIGLFIYLTFKKN